MVTTLLLAILGMALAGIVLVLPYTLRGAGGVELLVSLILLGLAILGGSRFWRKQPLLSLVLLLCPLLVVGLAMGRAQLNRVSDQHLEGCQENLRGLSSALDHYASAHGGLLPDRLQDCGQAVPSCPAAGQDTYSPAYAHADPRFTLLCQGSAHSSHFYDHPRCQADYPRYSQEDSRVLRWPNDSP